MAVQFEAILTGKTWPGSSTQLSAWHTHAHSPLAAFSDLSHRACDVQRRHSAFPHRVVGFEGRYRARPRPGQVRRLEQFVFCRPLGGLRRAASLGRSLRVAAVPAYMPWRLFWAYFVGVALLSASFSIATKIQVRWSGLLFGIMMFLFVAMMDLPGALASPRDRFGWTFLLREMSFAGGGWLFAGNAMRGPGQSQADRRGPRVDRDRRSILWR